MKPRLLERLLEEKAMKLKGGLYHQMQIKLDHEHKLFYYRGLKEFKTEKGYLTDTCRSAQDKYKNMVAYFFPDDQKV